jgi:hypothetical protein
MKALRVAIEKGPVGLYNSGNLDIRAVQSATRRHQRASIQKARDMAVSKSDDADAKGSGRHRLRTWCGTAGKQP